MPDQAFPLPREFIEHTIKRGPAEVDWLDRLPRTLHGAAGAWGLEVGPPFLPLSYNYVAPARLPDGGPAVLKAGFPGDDLRFEAEALRYFDGHACVRLLAADLEASVLLLERIEPGETLPALRDDITETAAAAEVMRELSRVPPEDNDFPRAEDWLRDASRPDAITATKQAFPWIGTMLSRATDLTVEPSPRFLLHGDLHHGNILRGADGDWRAIDPKGVTGPAEWEAAPFLFNELERFAPVDWPRAVRRRADQLAEALSLDRERLYAWSAVRSLQAAFWSLRDTPAHHTAMLVCTETLARGPA